MVSEQVSYAIWGSVVSSCKAFGKVRLNIHAETNRVFVEIELRWWAKVKKLEPFRRFWLKRAEKNAQEYVPNGWRLLVYYAKKSNGGIDSSSKRSTGKAVDDYAGGQRHRATGSNNTVDSNVSFSEKSGGSDEGETGRNFFSKAVR